MAIRSEKQIHANIPPGGHISDSRIGKALGLKSMETPSLMKAVHSGVSWSSIRKFLDITGFSQQNLSSYLMIPERTFARRREAGTFDRRESEQLLRLAELSCRFDSRLL